MAGMTKEQAKKWLDKVAAHASKTRLYKLRERPNVTLTPEQQKVADANFERYKVRHAAKIARLEGNARRGFLACLRATAVSQARHPWLGRKYPRNRGPVRLVKLTGRAKTILGLREPAVRMAIQTPSGGTTWISVKPSKTFVEEQVAAVHANHGQVAEAKESSTNMEGI